MKKKGYIGIIDPNPVPMTPTQIRRALLAELAGYFRGAFDTDQTGLGNAMEKALLIGVAYGTGEAKRKGGGYPEVGHVCNMLDIPHRYAKAVIDTLEGKE